MPPAGRKNLGRNKETEITMTREFLKDTFGWGFLLWLIGYGLGIALFTILPTSILGWVITPIGLFIMLWVLFKKIKPHPFSYYLLLAIVWTFIAIVCDYFFLVRAFHTTTYYKLDVYVYYLLMFLVPLLAGWKKQQK